MYSEVNWEGPRHPCGFASVGSSYYKMWVGLNGFDPRKHLGGGLSAWLCKDWHGLHESSYCYFKIYVGTCKLNALAAILYEDVRRSYFGPSKQRKSDESSAVAPGGLGGTGA